jgi:hypothetical protein
MGDRRASSRTWRVLAASSGVISGGGSAIPAQPIDQDTSANDTAAFAPIMDAVLGTRGSLLMGKAIVVHPRLLMCKVLQAIPLRSALSVNIDLVVQRREPKPSKVHNLLLESLSPKARELHILQPPVELHVLAGADLVRGAPDYVGCKQVQGSDLVVVAILVEEAPEAALGLALDSGQLVEGGELEVRGAGYGAGDGGEAVLGFLEDGAFFAVAHGCGCDTIATITMRRN